MKIVAVRKEFSKVICGFIMVLVWLVYGSNDNRLRLCERVEWMVCYSGRKYVHQILLTCDKPIFCV